ncbi:MAG: single-stranded-DNA-specific exonuclease RecJ [Eubacterium sp.]|nr:single-stranded-DNA-specific exonuclease RecJ [Eubacterium sp.]MCM1215312.1 single-stranded-DNA-specific exonuclease RecJ [Lachnospiraceae bacterium]MCM1240206.1 single-stranded-DNA-specific exonuclease RecJ [Lachnospiraceae bacterium]
MEKWYVAAKKADFDKWAVEFGISPVVARILRNRDLTESGDIRKFLYGTLEDCYSPWLLKDMDRAVELLIRAVSEQTAIRVIGDYDVDGICSSYILTKGLQILGAKVDTAIPHRIHDGYGLNDHLIEEAREDAIGMILTCDNGIAAAPQIELADSYGIQVIVTDHHEVPFSKSVDGEGRESRKELLPPALAVVDPKREDCTYPFSNICGGVVAYKLMQAMAEKTGSRNLREALDELLEFAAFATVCDVMELRDENRILVKEGLKRLKNTRNQGIRALMEVNGIEPEKLSAYHLGFVLGPCLNATGRLDTARRALELLQSGTKVEAMSAARELKELNDSRKNLTLRGVEQAESYIREHHLERDKVMVVFLPDVHESLAGIIAGRVREKYNHPVFILTRGEDGVKGSGRSIESYHMYEAMTAVKQYFTKYGGHKLAAGLSMREEDIEPLRKDLNEQAALVEEDFIPRVHIDVPMPLVYANEKLAGELELLEPFGVGNPRPLFAQKGLIFQSGHKMGANKTCARFRVGTPEGEGRQLVFFGDLERFGAFLDEKFGAGSEEALYAGRGSFPVSVVYQLGLNTYKGKTELQYNMQYYSHG